MQTSDALKIFCRINKSKIIFLIDIDFEKKKKKKKQCVRSISDFRTYVTCCGKRDQPPLNVVSKRS